MKIPYVGADLFALIKAPERTAYSGNGKGGDGTPDELEEMLRGIPVEWFRPGGKHGNYAEDGFFHLMASAHYYTRGEGEDVFVRYCATDPEYADAGEQVRDQWRALDSKRDGDVVTHKYLFKLLREAGRHDLQKPPKHVDDFKGVPIEPDFKSEFEPDDPDAEDDDFEDDGVPPEDGSGYLPDTVKRLYELNKEYTLVNENGKAVVICRRKKVFAIDGRRTERYFVERMQARDFAVYFGNHKAHRDPDMMSKNQAPTIPLGTAWLTWENRNTKEQVVFDPTNAHGPDVLNLYTGFGVEAAAGGTCERFKAMMLENLCAGNREHFEYLWKWCAFAVQRPAEPAQACVIFQGDHGTGKGTFGRVFGEIFGQHGLHITASGQLTARFNAHFEDAIFVFGDECVKPYDNREEAAFRSLVTEPTLSIEGKGRDIAQVPNRLHIVLASNHDWVAAMAANERRFFVLNTVNSWGNGDPRWNALYEELFSDEKAGVRRLLFELMATELGDWSPRHPPQTAGMAQQRLYSLNPVQAFLYSVCEAGAWDTPPVKGVWNRSRIRIFESDFWSQFVMWAKRAGINPGANGRAMPRLFFKQVQMVFPDARDGLLDKVPEDFSVPSNRNDQRASSWELPSLPDCRARFDEMLGTPQKWPEPDEDDMDFG
ncbi:primase-helicase family protein [Rhodopseudomonas palustris]